MVKPTHVTNSIRTLRFANGEMTQADLADRVGDVRGLYHFWNGP